MKRKPYRLLLQTLTLSLLMVSQAAFGQFNLVSTSPAHGAVNIDTAATLSLTFNAPVDTSARFDYPGFFLSLVFEPDSLTGEPDSITLSPDMTTVFVHNLKLQANTAYRFVLADAVSQSGDSLAEPFFFLFTTGATLPGATLSGTIGFPGNDPTGTLVALLDGNPFGEGDDDAEIVNATVISGASGGYSINYIEPGTYWLAAIKNFILDNDGEIQFTSNSALGFYDPNGDHFVDSLVISGSSQVSNIDFPISTLAPQLARAAFAQVEPVILDWAADAELVAVSGDNMTALGLANSWQFVFYSPSQMAVRGMQSLGSLVIASSFTDSLDNTITLPSNWLNSDSVMAIAEGFGGSDYRQQHPDAEVNAFLAFVDLFNQDDSSGRTAMPTVPRIDTGKDHPQHHAFSGFGNHFRTGATAVTDTFPAFWLVQYYSPDTTEGLMAVIDAVTGEILNAPATAEQAEAKALPLAREWAGDARLWSLSNGPGLEPDGKSGFWSATYYSASLDSLQSVFVWGQLAVNSEPQQPFFPDTVTIPDGWTNSDAVMALTEANGGADYRSANPDADVRSLLSYHFEEPASDLIVWRIDYFSSTAPPLFFLIDAFTGMVVGLENIADPALPAQFSLQQNYPNPFNPATTIEFTLPKTAEASLKIYNALGESVDVLVSEMLPAGRYRYRWEASGYASGIYFFRLSAGTFQQTRKMMLVR